MRLADVRAGQYVRTDPELMAVLEGRVVEVVHDSLSGADLVAVRWDNGHLGHVDAEHLVLDERYAQPVST